MFLKNSTNIQKINGVKKSIINNRSIIYSPLWNRFNFPKFLNGSATILSIINTSSNTSKQLSTTLIILKKSNYFIIIKIRRLKKYRARCWMNKETAKFVYPFSLYWLIYLNLKISKFLYYSPSIIIPNNKAFHFSTF